MTRTMIRIPVENAQHTHAVAAAMAADCSGTECLMLRGDLGAGKTTFARGFIGAVDQEAGDVVSPTFTLVQTYGTPPGRVIRHFDLYRLQSEGEVEETGLDEALETGITLIEWPELVQHRLPASSLDVHIGFGEAPEDRLITLTGEASVWQGRFKVLEEYARGN